MSIKEIAAKLNVSKSTVSLVINGKAEQGRISVVLAKRILDYVESIGYKPNSLAKSLATGKSRTIGLIVENIGDSFFGPIALYIEEYLREHDYYVLYSSTLGDLTLANRILAMMLDKKVDGVIIAPALGQKKEIQKLLDNKIPLVVFDRRIPSLKTNYIGTDNYSASKKAVKHLFDNGYSSVGMITIDSQQIQMLDRLRGYQEIVQCNNADSKILEISYRLDEGNRKMLIQEFLNSNTFDALYFTTNYLCVNTLKILKLGLCNKKYKMICFDDHEIFELNTPTISCIRQPVEDIAKEIVQTLLVQINQPDKQFTDVIISSELMFRESSK